jgi:hypothetical protein
VAVALQIIRMLRRAGTRADRAAAEAILIVELAGLGESWEKAVRAMVV